mmetsp:Transcript_43214/g.105761  ORF Transcript_43214/g.105761 Transcript_43214/m.105761 type:complete len:582 (+) Transcript_43214:94-1839(+)
MQGISKQKSEFFFTTNSGLGGPHPSTKRSISLPLDAENAAAGLDMMSDQPPNVLRAELLQNIPVEGVELEPYVLVQFANGQNRQITDDDDSVLFKWSRCEYTASSDTQDGPKTCIVTGRPATMQCLLPDVTFDINGVEYSHEHAYFASVEEFSKAWMYHKRITRGQGGETPKPRRQDPSRDFVNIWQEIGTQRIYVPQKQDVGRILKLECTPISQNGLYTGKTQSVESSEVLPAPRSAPPRGFVDLPNTQNNFHLNGPKVSFKVLSYNCLADIYATPQVYPYTAAWALAWNYRKRNLLREIIGYKADILALQEIQADHYKEWFEPEMRALGYEGVYKQKTRESMGQDGKMDGCAILYKRSRFSLVEKHALEFNHVAMSRAKHFKNDKALQCLLKDNVALVLVLEVLQNGQSTGPNGRVCVATTHIYQNQGFPNVKIWQVMTLVRELEKFTVPRQLPLVLTGDLNSQTDSAVYEFLQNNNVKPNHPELMDDAQGILESAELRHGLQLRDTHAVLGKDFYSNYTAGFIGVLDYIWHTADRLRPTRILEQVDNETLSAHTALPSPMYSSDHVALMAEFELYPPR